MEVFLFYLFAVVAVAAALGMIFGRNAAHAVLLMVVNFSMLAMLYLLLGAPFLAMVQIIVYAGAILVLFLFVVMLMGQDPGPLWEQMKLQRPLALLLAIAMIALLVPVVSGRNILGAQFGDPVRPFSSDPHALAEGLFGGYVLPLETIAIILLTAMIGAVVLAKRDAYRTKREELLNLDEV